MKKILFLNTIQCKAWKNRALFLMLALVMSVANAWAGGGTTTTFYSKATVAVKTGIGTVYVNNTSPATSGNNTNNSTTAAATNNTTTQNAEQEYYISAEPATDYRFDKWEFSNWSTNPSTSTATTSGKVKATSTTESSPSTGTAQATFLPISIASVEPTSVPLNPTDARTSCSDYTGSVVFTTTNDNAASQIGTPTFGSTTGSGTWNATNNWAASKSTVTYTFKGNGYYGGSGTSSGSRSNSATLTLPTAGGTSYKSVTFTANFPSLVLSDAAENNTAYPINPTSDGTGSVVFPVQYCDGAFDFTATITGASGGTFTLGTISFTQTNAATGSGNITVPFTFNAGGAEGDFSATLTLTPQANTGGTAKSVTITAYAEAEAENDVSVTTAAGVTTEYATWAEGLAAANANAGCTLTLLRNIDLTGTYGITSTQGITQTFTLDLNGKILSGATNGSILNPNTKNKTLTIKDSKIGGKIQNIADLNGALYAINVGAGATLNVESGYIYVENQSQYAYGTSTYTDGTPNISNMQARGIHMAATSKVNVSGGKIHAVASCNAFGVREESSKANNTVLTITGGEIIGEAPRYAYGIYASGKVNISGGTITALLNDKTVNGNTTYTANYWNDYTLHRYGYGIQMFAYSNATAANCYFGTLAITGGTINAINVNKTLKSTTVQSEHTYGIYMNVSATGAGAGKTAPDGSKVMKACAIGLIENATINVTHAGSTAYGVMAVGCYNSFDNSTTPLQIKNTTINVEAFAAAYGVYANGYVNWSSTLANHTGNGGCTAGEFELTNTTINATTTGGAGAYCAWAGSTSGTVADAKATTGSQSTGNATYCGEYAAAGKITVNSGTYTANAATSSAYGIGSSDRAKTVRSIKGALIGRDAAVDPLGSLGGAAEAYPELNIHGGNFSATTGTSTAVAVKSGGTTLIDGGTFNAFAGTSDAYGLKINSGVTTANGVTFPASATTKAYGVYITGTVSDWSLFAYAGEAILNNCNVTATTRTTTEARAVYIDGATKTYTQASFDAMKSANNSNYKNYGDYAQVGERSIMGRATINGGTYSATAETTTAYGAVLAATKVSTNAIAVASGNLEIHDAKFIVKTNGTTTAIGVYAGGPTIIDGCDITVQPKTGTAKGVHAYDKKTTITNTKFDVKATTEARLFYAEAAIGSTTGWDYHGEFELGEGNECVATATGGNTAHILTLLATKRNIASGKFAGDYANASSALVTGGSYKATATGKTSYVLNLSAEQVQGDVKAAPSCIIEGGKFWAMADGGTTGICSTNGVIGNILFKGGVYNVNTMLSKHIPEGYEEFPLPDDRPEYTEGYRYAIEPVGNHGNYVCQIGSTKYKTLEEALQVVTSGQVIYMIANYTMTTPGDYVLPPGATLLIPYKDGTGKGASTAIGNFAETTTSATTPTLFRKLTLGEGVNLTCFGFIETSAQQKANGQYGANVGMPSGAYGQIHLEEGSHISLETNSRLNCWGYITGQGTINVKKGATSLEGFQLGDWCGGTNVSDLIDNSDKVFPVTHYFYQSIECPITYRPGSKALGSTHIYASSTIAGQDDIALVGTTGSMFLMDENDESAETWLMKDYDEATDQCVWTINSGASIGSLTINIEGEIDIGFVTMPLSYSLKSANYDLPITTNMSVVLNYGEMEVGQNAVFLPGSKLIVNKQGTAVLNGVTVTAYDAAHWTGTTIYRATYSPTWGTTNPRSTTPVDAEFFLHGKVDIRDNGGLYTTPGGANIHSTNADAGEVIYTTAAQGDKTNYYLQQGTTSRKDVTTNPARLKNGDGSYAASAGTTAAKTWTYYDDKWQCWTQSGCFTYDAQNNPYIKPAAYVQVTSDQSDVNKLHHDAETGLRNFVWDENCYWWEVVTTPTAEGYYKSLNADHNGNYNYYYYDSAADCWKIKKITVTWNVNGTNTNYSVGYGTKPEWFGATPTKTSSSSDFVWRWDGWTMGSDPTVLANNNLPFVTEDIIFTAHFYEKHYEYNITFKNDDGTILESKNWIAGTTPSYEGTPTKNPTAAETFEFNGTWTPAIATVSGPATYVAQYNATPRKYAVTFMNYDMSVLGTAEVPYGSTPTRATYLDAVAPLKDDPYKPDNSAYLFEFAGWRLYGASSNGFVGVAGDQMYIAQYNQTKKYLIQILDIVDADGTYLTINANGWASSGWPYTINDTPYEKTTRKADRTLVIPYSGQPNNDMPIEVKDEEGNIISSHIYKVFVYDSNTTMSGTDENSIVFVKSGTLRIEGTASAKEIYVAPGAALQVNENGTLDVKKLVLRTTPFEAAILTNKGTIVGQVYYSRIARDQGFHLFAIPAGSNTANVVLSDGSSCAVNSTTTPYGAAWQLREYNTARRAKLGADGANWDNIGVNADKTTYSDVAIEASKGYELRSGSKYYREYLFPVTLPTTADSVGVTAATGAAGAAHAGWNILCSPYTGIYTVKNYNDPATAIKVCWQQTDGSYIQEQPKQIKPAVPFAYQASQTGALAFDANLTFAAPAPRKQSAAEALTETEWVHLDIFDAYGEGDETSLFVHPTRFEQTYKTGIDMAKQSLTASRAILYTTHAYGDMAFAGVADSLLENGIDLVVYSPAAQELTFSLRENKFLHRLEYLWLADNETGARTDLLMDDYTFRADAGTAKGRFVLNGRFKAPQISTGIGNTQTDYNIYAIGNNIAISGVEQGTPIYVFDAVGHMIYTTAATSDEVIVPAPCAGVYMLSVGGQTAKLVINQ